MFTAVSFKDYENIRVLLRKHIDDKQAMEGLTDLFNRPYFTRAWILQEIILATKATVVSG
jgi:hypothetical protein